MFKKSTNFENYDVERTDFPKHEPDVKKFKNKAKKEVWKIEEKKRQNANVMNILKLTEVEMKSTRRNAKNNTEQRTANQKPGI